MIFSPLERILLGATALVFTVIFSVMLVEQRAFAFSKASYLRETHYCEHYARSPAFNAIDRNGQLQFIGRDYKNRIMELFPVLMVERDHTRYDSRQWLREEQVRGWQRAYVALCS